MEDTHDTVIALYSRTAHDCRLCYFCSSCEASGHAPNSHAQPSQGLEDKKSKLQIARMRFRLREALCLAPGLLAKQHTPTPSKRDKVEIALSFRRLVRVKLLIMSKDDAPISHIVDVPEYFGGPSLAHELRTYLEGSGQD